MKLHPEKDILFIDIDDTITRFRSHVDPESLGIFRGQLMLYLAREAAVLQKGITRQEAERIITEVHELTPRWHWADFICALGLDPVAFWQYAYAEELKYREPVSDSLPEVFDGLCRAGYKMIITSNNPVSGSMHKLRIAGLGEVCGTRYFLQVVGAQEMGCLKEDAAFWRCVLAHTGVERSRVIVIGDIWSDDVEAPLAAGIESRIYMDWERTGAPACEDGVWRVNSWRQVMGLLLEEDGAARTPFGAV